MFKIVVFIFSLFMLSCIPHGKLPVDSTGVNLSKVRDSSFEQNIHFTWIVMKVSNYSNETMNTFLTCTFTNAEGFEEISVKKVWLRPWRYKEYYLSAPITSMFSVTTCCSLEENHE